MAVNRIRVGGGVRYWYDTGGGGACVVWALEGRGEAGRDRGVFQSVTVWVRLGGEFMGG